VGLGRVDKLDGNVAEWGGVGELSKIYTIEFARME